MSPRARKTATPTPGPAREIEWITGGVDRSEPGAIFTHLIRSPDDPERRSRKARQDAMGKSAAAVAWKALKASAPLGPWREQILALLADGQPRTFNAITVTLADITADVAFGGAADDALWALVAERALEHTTTAPVLFRLTIPQEAP